MSLWCRLPGSGTFGHPGVLVSLLQHPRHQEDRVTDSHQADDQPTPRIPDYPIELPPLLPGQVLTRTMVHPDELNPRGFLITCACCGASRDWLLVNIAQRVYVRCRCTHEWAEPDLDVETFDNLFSYIEAIWGSYTDAVRANGFDGFLAGTVWNE